MFHKNRVEVTEEPNTPNILNKLETASWEAECLYIFRKLDMKLKIRHFFFFFFSALHHRTYIDFGCQRLRPQSRSIITWRRGVQVDDRCKRDKLRLNTTQSSNTSSTSFTGILGTSCLSSAVRQLCWLASS